MAAGKVLIVDDLPDWRATLSGLLGDQGFDVQVASSIDSALRILENEKVHVAVLDVRLDESDEDNRDGLILMRRIKERWPSVEVIILTGYADIRMAQELINTDHNGERLRLAHSFLEKDQIRPLLERVKQAYESSVRILINRGEQENIEFKSSIRWDYSSSSANKKLQKNIIKAIVGMMNNKGGELLIGIGDNGEILGIENDLLTLGKPTQDQVRTSINKYYPKFCWVRVC